MLEKNGMLPLTPEEKAMIEKGTVPAHLKAEFGDSPLQLQELVKAGEYRVKHEANKPQQGE